MSDENEWHGIEGEISDDPEEVRVIYQALDSFFQYAHVAHFYSTHMRRQSFYALPQEHWKLLAGPPFNYLETLDQVDAAIENNAKLARAIATAGLNSFHALDRLDKDNESSNPYAEVVIDEDGLVTKMPGPWAGSARSADTDKARSTVRQFYRDWSEEGKSEREACYGPVKRFLEEERERRLAQQDEAPIRVLVPGAGLGRLVFDLCSQGYDVEGNEISYHSLLGSAFALNHTTRVGQHTIHPWIHGFSNHVSRKNQMRGYAVPDVVPCQLLNDPPRPGGNMAMTAADFLCLYDKESQRETFDCVACVFFLDTAPNVIRYLQTIRSCLKPGGVLINVGPLLWHFENNAPGNHGRDDDGDGEHEPSNSSGIADPGSFELTDEEMIVLVEKLGFEIVRRDPEHIAAGYIRDPDSLLSTTYKAASWVARKLADWHGEI